MKPVSLVLFFFFLFFFGCISALNTQEISLSPSQIQEIGEKVFTNECASKDACLLQWNEGENFLSLGIGHFIWYPADTKELFEESFTKFLNYLKAGGKEIPLWLNESPKPACPWKSREEFLTDSQSPKVLELRSLLLETKKEQAAFLIKQLHQALPVMTKTLPDELRAKITKQFFRVASTPSGVYALVDYLNFKGSGVFPSERYKNQGWGLKQVLETMSGEENGAVALEEFAAVAQRLLSERVANSPPQRNEKKWLLGWKNRVRSYLADEKGNEALSQ